MRHGSVVDCVEAGGAVLQVMGRLVYGLAGVRPPRGFNWIDIELHLARCLDDALGL